MANLWLFGRLGTCGVILLWKALFKLILRPQINSCAPLVCSRWMCSCIERGWDAQVSSVTFSDPDQFSSPTRGIGIASSVLVLFFSNLERM